MNNLVVLVGRLVKKPEIIEENGHKCCYITLAINRNFKNKEGIYETDFIDIKVLYPTCDSVVEYCEKGDAIGVKGVVERLSQDKSVKIVADKITFICSGRGGEIKND